MKQQKILSNTFVYVMIFALVAFSAYAAQSSVDLGTAGNFIILAKSGVSTTGTTSIVGDIGVSPISSTALTGFALTVDSSNKFSTSHLVTGKIYASDYTPPTPAMMTTAISDMETAYTDAAARTLPDHTELGAGNIGGMTLTSGLYKWSTDVIIPADVTLSGSSTDVWIFQVAKNLDISGGKHIILIGGAQAKNIFWQVAGQATLETTSVFSGNILSKTAIVLDTGATLNGRALAQKAVTLDANKVSLNSNNVSNHGGVPKNTIAPLTIVSGKVIDANNDSVIDADVAVACTHDGIPTTKNVLTDGTGTYYAFFGSTECNTGDSVAAHTEGAEDQDGIVSFNKDCRINTLDVNLQIPEFGVIAGAIALLAGIGIVAYRRK